MSMGWAFWLEMMDDLPNNVEIARIAVRLGVAIVLGGILAHNGPTWARRRESAPTCSSPWGLPSSSCCRT